MQCLFGVVYTVATDKMQRADVGVAAKPSARMGGHVRRRRMCAPTEYITDCVGESYQLPVFTGGGTPLCLARIQPRRAFAHSRHLRCRTWRIGNGTGNPSPTFYQNTGCVDEILRAMPSE